MRDEQKFDASDDAPEIVKLSESSKSLRNPGDDRAAALIVQNWPG
jgi:hypothetical protein